MATEVTTSQRVISLGSINGAHTDSGNGESRMTTISADGRFIAFTSSATNLVPGLIDINGEPDVFLHDRLNNITILVSRRNSSNFTGNGPSGWLGPASTIGISADGRFVVYASQASDLFGFDNNGVSDIFVYNRDNGSTSLVSHKSTDYTATANGSSIMPVISANGEVVTFISLASDLAASNDTNGKFDVYASRFFLVELVSPNIAGSNGGNENSSAHSTPLSISDDGRFVAFDSEASDLVTNDTNGGGVFGTDVFVRDLQNNTTALASINSGGTGSGNLDSFNSGLRISGNGRFAVFASRATDLVTSITDANGGTDIFIRDLLAGVTSIISINLAGNGSGLNLSQFPAVSDDGRFVAFTSRASNLVPTDTNNGLEGGGGIADVFVRDTQAGITELVSINSSGTDSGNSSSSGPAEIGADGRYVVFTSNATNLTGISDTNSGTDLFLRDLQTDSTTLVTVNRFGSAGGANTSGFSLSNNDQVIAFESQSTLTLNDNNGTTDVFVSGPTPPGLSVSDVTVTEGDTGTTDAVFTITLTDGPMSGNITATAITSSDSAGGSVDFQLVSSALTFTPGETTKTVTVPIIGDLIYEPNEMFTLVLRDVVGAAVVDGIGVGTILENEPQPTLSINDVTITEGDSGRQNAIFTVSLSGRSQSSVGFSVSVANGTAVEQEDFSGVGGGAGIGAGFITNTFSVPIIGDTITEPNETLFMNLSNPNGATISDGQGVATIIDDESASESPTVQLVAFQRSVPESGGSIAFEVTRSGNLSAPATVGYATSSPSGISDRNDYNAAFGRLSFAAGESSKTFTVFITDDVFVEGNEFFLLTLSSPTGGTSLGSPEYAVVRIVDNDIVPPLSNPVDTPSFIVRQHYVDFLNREPDAEGLAFWSAQIISCGTDTACIELRRINVSAAFFLSIEFQQTGYLVYRMYRVGYGNLPNAPVPVRLEELLPDTVQIGQGLVVGQPGWEQVLENNKQAFAADFVARSRFTSAYPTTLTPTEFVDALFTNAGVTPSATDRDAAISEFGGAGDTTNTSARARALRRVAENTTLAQQQTNKAFVLMQYFGYLRRNPNDAPDSNFDGYNFWLNKLNQFNGNFISAEMVKAFIVSIEYRQRFGP